MKPLVEIAMCLLHDDRLQSIDNSLALLNAAQEVGVKTGRGSTLLHGEQATVTDLLKEATAAFRVEEEASTAFLLKMFPGARRTLNGYS